jgi:hypothetical protein
MTEKSITGTDRAGSDVTLAVGDRVTFRNWRGQDVTDVVRGGFMAHHIVEPYGRNYSEPAVVLTSYSWVRVADIEKVTP